MNQITNTFGVRVQFSKCVRIDFFRWFVLFCVYIWKKNCGKVTTLSLIYFHLYYYYFFTGLLQCKSNKYHQAIRRSRIFEWNEKSTNSNFIYIYSDVCVYVTACALCVCVVCCICYYCSDLFAFLLFFGLLSMHRTFTFPYCSKINKTWFCCFFLVMLICA